MAKYTMSEDELVEEIEEKRRTASYAMRAALVFAGAHDEDGAIGRLRDARRLLRQVQVLCRALDLLRTAHT